MGPALPQAAPTPACQERAYPDAAALLAALPRADYACAEELAVALRPFGGPQTVDALLALLASDDDTRARRNALRALGRLAESPRSSRARETALGLRGAALQAALMEVLARERENFLLQDAIWALDTFFYPSPAAAPALERVAADPGAAPALRYRAARARARLLAALSGPPDPAARAFLRGALASPNPGVRAAAADGVARLRAAQLDPALTAELGEALAAARRAAPPLRLPADAQTAPTPGRFDESAPTDLSARAAIARAEDRLAGQTSGTRLEALRAAYVALALPNSYSSGRLSISSGLAPAALADLAKLLDEGRSAFVTLVGPNLSRPISAAGEPPLRVVIFANQATYREYMRAFTPFSVDVDGIYDEASATLYTHQRSAQQSENTLAETLLHEQSHHLAGASLFPGTWQSPGYHTEPKGWADEGLAELLAGLQDGDLAPRPRQLARLCARAAPPDLNALLARRAGYDRFGSFDYDGAWALSFFLVERHPAALPRLYTAYRDGSYRLERWSAIAGLPAIPSIEPEWQLAIGNWCADQEVVQSADGAPTLGLR